MLSSKMVRITGWWVPQFPSTAVLPVMQQVQGLPLCEKGVQQFCQVPNSVGSLTSYEANWYLIETVSDNYVMVTDTYTVNPALLASSFVWLIQLYFLHISLFKIIKRKYFIQSKCEFMKLLFVLLGKIKILPLYTVYLPHQLLHMLFFTPFRNFWATVFLT